ncbi:MAG: hypothetical protein Q8O67_23680, partial [Deltaproteobacteria bacterium]|nr:hypothetical protein [Deltaproteobacteria bacterium]
RLSPFAFRLSPFAFRLSPFAFRLSPFAFRLSPFAFRLSPFAFRLSLFRSFAPSLFRRSLLAPQRTHALASPALLAFNRTAGRSGGPEVADALLKHERDVDLPVTVSITELACEMYASRSKPLGGVQASVETL